MPTRPQGASSSQQADESRNDDLPPRETRQSAAGNATSKAVDGAAADEVFATFSDGEDDEGDLLGLLSDED